LQAAYDSERFIFAEAKEADPVKLQDQIRVLSSLIEGAQRSELQPLQSQHEQACRRFGCLAEAVKRSRQVAGKANYFIPGSSDLFGG